MEPSVSMGLASQGVVRLGCCLSLALRRILTILLWRKGFHTALCMFRKMIPYGIMMMMTTMMMMAVFFLWMLKSRLNENTQP